MESIYNYRDPVHYIQDYINDQKSQDPNFTLRSWSQALDFKSPSVIVDILNGKRKLRGRPLELLMAGLPIDNAEKMYFQAITERSQVNNHEKVKMYDLIIKELTPFAQDHSDHFSSYRNEKQIDIYSHWVYMAILSITDLNHFDFSIDNIKAILCEDLETGLIEKALFQLFQHGFLKKDESGQVTCPYSSCSSKTDSKADKNVLSYYTTICDLAKKAVHYAPEEREFQCFSVALPKNNIPLAKEILRKARAQIASLGSDDQDNDIVYQGNLMLFPLTKHHRQ